jgi:hypothetical protein
MQLRRPTHTRAIDTHTRINRGAGHLTLSAFSNVSLRERSNTSIAPNASCERQGARSGGAQPNEGHRIRAGGTHAVVDAIHGTESVLPGDVPQLQRHGHAVHVKLAEVKIHANGGPVHVAEVVGDDAAGRGKGGGG